MKGWRLFAFVIVAALVITSGALLASVAIGKTQRSHEISFYANQTNSQGWFWTELRLLDVDTLTTTTLTRNIDDATWTSDGSAIISLAAGRWTTNRDDELVLYDVLRGFRSAQVIKVENLPADEGATISAAWSPDGQHLAFMLKTFNALNDLYVYTPAIGQTQNLSQTALVYEEVFAWSPDSQHLAYTNRKAELWVSTSGSEPRKLPIKLADPARKPLWSPDSSSLLVKAIDDMTAGTQITVSDGTQTILPVCTLSDDDVKYISKLAWHPDGRLTCTTRDKKTRITDILLVDLTTNTSTVIGQEKAVVDNLAWSSDGLYLLYQADATILAFNVMAYDDTAHRLTQMIRVEGGKAVWRPAP